MEKVKTNRGVKDVRRVDLNFEGGFAEDLVSHLVNMTPETEKNQEISGEPEHIAYQRMFSRTFGR